MPQLPSMALSCLLLAAVSTAAPAAPPPAGQLVLAQGEVTLNGRPVRAEEPVYPGMQIATGPVGLAQVVFADGENLMLGPFTRVYLGTYADTLAQRPAPQRSHIELVHGSARWSVGPLSEQLAAPLTLETPAGAVTLHGADARLISDRHLYLSVARGALTVTNAAGSTTFEEGQYGFVAGPAVRPDAIPPAQTPPGPAAALARLGAVPVHCVVPATAVPPPDTPIDLLGD